MKIDEGYPVPRKHKENELATLQYIKDNDIFWQSYPTLANDANQSFIKFQKAPSLSFSSSLEICLDRKSGKVGVAHLGSDIVTKDDQYEQVSYSLAICSRDNERLLRKYHFDYALPDEKRRQPHPVFHLQYAGGLSGHLMVQIREHKHIDSWLSEPRLFFMPLSLALLINVVLKEFPDGNGINMRIIERREWRELIKKNEKLFLVPYFRSCHNFMNSINNVGKLLTNDFYYGN